MHEYIINLHMHTPYSDGTGTHQDIATAAIQAGIDAVIVTDHNVWVDGLEGYYEEDEKRVLVLGGEEVHDQTRDPQKNHLMIFGVDQEMATYAPAPQNLITQVKNAGGLSFIAHPHDPEAPNFNEGDLSWVDWEVRGFTGIELWNAMSEFKSLLSNHFQALRYVFNPEDIAHGPYPQVLEKWDELTTAGLRVVAIGGSDAHAMVRSLGPIRRVLFPYEFHFQAVNTHIFTPTPFTGEARMDRNLILAALQQGHAFVAYDLPAPTLGFRFYADGLEQSAWMGDQISGTNGVTFQIRLPQRTECHLIKDGEIVKSWFDREITTYTTTEPGVYRVEVYIPFRGKRRGWIFSNPIYVK